LLQIPTVQSWLSLGNTNVDATVVDHVIEEANQKLRDAVRRNFEEPEQHLQWFGESLLQGDIFKLVTIIWPTVIFYCSGDNLLCIACAVRY